MLWIPTQPASVVSDFQSDAEVVGVLQGGAPAPRHAKNERGDILEGRPSARRLLDSLPRMDTVSFLATILIALFGGAGAAVLVEGWYRPWLDRRYVAKLLFHELNKNIQLLDANLAIRQAEPHSTIAGHSLSTVAIDAVKEKLGALPAESAAWVINTYYGYQHFRDIALDCERLSHEVVEKQNTAPEGLDSILRGSLRDYDRYAKQCLDDSIRTRDMLAKWAGSRRWMSEAPRRSSRN